MELRHLRYFLAVVDAGGFRAAGRRVHVTQPTLSRTVRELEDELQTVLLDRSGDPVTPTAAGRIVAERARRLLADADALVVEVRAEPVRIGHVLPEYLGALSADRPVRVTPVLPRHVGARLREGALDAAVVFLPYEGDQSGLAIHPLGHDRLVAAVPADDPDEAPSLAGLAERPVVLFPRAAMPERHDELLGSFTRAGLRPRIVTVGPSLRAALEAVAGGAGVSLVPWRAARAHADLRVALRPIRGLGTVWTLAAVHREPAPPGVAWALDVLRRAHA